MELTVNITPAVKDLIIAANPVELDDKGEPAYTEKAWITRSVREFLKHTKRKGELKLFDHDDSGIT